MAIFELDDGRGTLVQPMRPSADSFEVDSSALVGEHVAALLGERVFPVRRGGDGTGPHLLALDAASQPVVVEVVQLLDADGLVRALRHAGGAGRLSRSDLSRMYHGGPDAFEADLAVFRDRAPIVRSQSTGRAGVRLVLVCAEVEDGLADVVDFVAAGTQVEVLRLGVAEGPGGRRYVDVSPLRRTRSRERRPVEPGPRTGSVAVQAPPAVATPVPSDADRSAPTTAPTPVQPEPAPTGAAHAAPSAGDDAVEARTAPRASQEAAHGHAHAADETTLLPLLDAEGHPVEGGPAHDHTPLPELAALAAAGPGAVELVWLRVRRGQRLTATLRADGLIELPGGAVHADPDTAASAAADLESATDGWRVWRLGDHGPSLREATGAQS
ncbi:MAG TPA: hypothetical protein VGC57_11145 [Cellulomonas sp.]